MNFYHSAVHVLISKAFRAFHLHGLTRAFVVASVLVIDCYAPVFGASYITVFGSRTFTASGGGATSGYPSSLNESGVVIGDESTFGPAPGFANLGTRGVRFDGSGAEPVPFGTTSGGVLTSMSSINVRAINDSGVVVGIVDANVGTLGNRAARWASGSTTATLLGNPPGAGPFHASPTDINNAGTAVGSVHDNSLGVTRAVRWNSSGIAATLLGVLQGPLTHAQAVDVNEVGQIAGRIGARAVRWDVAGVAHVLGEVAGETAPQVLSTAVAINDHGVVWGTLHKYDSRGNSIGDYPVRWDAVTLTATQLDILAPYRNVPNAIFGTYVNGVNSAGAAVGSGVKHVGTNSDFSSRALRWDAGSTSVTELENLVELPDGTAESGAWAVNTRGFAVGRSAIYDDQGAYVEFHAVYWNRAGNVVDLNDLIDPQSGWVLNEASEISDSGWVAGAGLYDPDGSGGQDAYQRMFLMQVPAVAVPEPSAVMLAGIWLVVTLKCRRGRCVAPPYRR